MSDTPETQKAVMESNGQWSFVLKECCERLERERDEAREALASREVMIAQQNVITDLLLERDEARDKYATEATDHMLAVNKLCNERDEAVEEIKEWKTLCLWGGTPEHIHGFIRGQQSRIQHLECERDEAMELLASEKITRNHIIKRSVEVERERDEAREHLKLSVVWQSLRDSQDEVLRLTLENRELRNLSNE